MQAYSLRETALFRNRLRELCFHCQEPPTVSVMALYSRMFSMALCGSGSVCPHALIPLTNRQCFFYAFFRKKKQIFRKKNEKNLKSRFFLRIKRFFLRKTHFEKKYP